MTDQEILDVIHLLADNEDAARAAIDRMNGLERMTLRLVAQRLHETVHASSAASLAARDARDRLGVEAA